MQLSDGVRKRLISILPYQDAFSASSYGAVSLCVEEWLRYSDYQTASQVLGLACKDVLNTAVFHPIAYHKQFFEGNTQAYAKACIENLLPDHHYLIEIHNRPKMVAHLAGPSAWSICLFFHNDPLSMGGAKSIEDRMRLIAQCEHIFFNSYYTYRRFLSGLKLVPEVRAKLSVQYQGVDFHAMDREPVVEKKKQLVFVGRLTPTKGALRAVQAMQKVLPAHPDWKVVFVAPSSRHEQSYVADFHKAREALGVQSRYESFLLHHEVLQLFQTSAIACLPSVWQEPFGRVVLEAMAAGCACITSNRGGIPEIAGDAAILLDDLSVASLAEQIERLIVQADLRARYQSAAKARMRACFDLRTQTRHLDQRRCQWLSSAVTC